MNNGGGTINFAIPTALAVGGVYTIPITNAYNLSQNVTITIDATTQTGWLPNQQPIVIIKGLTTVNNGTVGGNQFDGIDITNGTGHTIKGLIFQNFVNGINVSNNVNNVTVEGCWFGIDPTGETNGGYTGTGYGIAQAGILLSNGTGHIIGGVTTTKGAYPGNVLSGCCMESSGNSGAFYGAVYINGASAVNVQGNIIGLNATGTSGANIGNGDLEPLHQHGILIASGGNTSTIVNNVISNNIGTGIYVTAGTPSSISITGNMVGTDILGMTPIGNRGGGISFINGGTGIKIGGNSPTLRNIISGNGGAPDSRNCRANQYNGSLAGCSISPCAAACPQDYDGTLQCGIYLNNVSSSQIAGNYIGTDATGKYTSAATLMPSGTPVGNLNGLGNLYAGIKVEGNSTNNTIGGTSPAYRNIIGGNGFDPFVTTGNAAPYLGHGIQLNNASVTGTLVQYNFVGIGSDGATEIGNRQDGISLEGASNSKIYNNISSDNAYGIFLQTDFNGGEASNNIIAGNYIGTDSTGLINKGNGVRAVDAGGDGGGIGIQMTAKSNTVGNATQGGNVISGNLQGIVFRQGATGYASPLDNTVAYNYIGLGSDGLTSIPNTNFGIVISGGANNNTIGGASGAGNYIANNGKTGYGAGIWLDSAKSNIISYNFIGVNKSLTAAPNLGDGIQITNGSVGNIIGGTAGQGNIITSNTGNGIEILNPDATGSYNNAINNNSIFCNSLRGIELNSLGNNDYAPFSATAPHPANSLYLTGSPTNFQVVGPTGSWIELYYADTTCNNCGSNSTNNKLQGKTLVASGASPLSFTPPAGKTNIVYVATASSINPATNLVHNTSEFTSCATLCTIAVTAKASSATVCSGNATLLTATPTGAQGTVKYAWISSPTSTITNTTDTATVKPTVATTYTVTATDANNCAATANVSVAINPLPTVSASADSAAICFGNYSTITASPAGGTSPYKYQWSASGSNISGATNAKYKAQPTTTTTYTVTATDANNCMATTKDTVKVTPLSVPPTTTKAITYCQGASATPLTATGTNLLWYTVATGGTSSATAPTPSTATVGTTSYYVSQTTTGNCESKRDTITVTINALPTVTITNPAAVCSPSTVDLTAAAVTAGSTSNLTYTYWTNAGATTSLSPSNAVAASGTYYIKGTIAGTGCDVIKPVTVTINSLPTVSITNPATVCAPSTINLMAAAVTTGSTTGLAYTYWTDAGATSSLSNPNAVATSGTYYIKGTIAATGCDVIKPVVVTINSQPSIPVVTAGGPTTFCSGLGSVLLTATDATSGVGVTYQWYKNSAAIGGATSATYSASLAGGYTVVVTSANPANCPSKVSDTITVTINSTPNVPTLSLSGPTTFCSGDSLILTASDATAGVIYQWYDNGVKVSGDTLNKYKVTASGKYTVAAISGATDGQGGCASDTTASTKVTVNSLPPTPTVSANGPLTFCDKDSVTLQATPATGYNYQWYNKAGKISGATASSYKDTISGVFTVLITNPSTNCVSDTSAKDTVVVNPLPAKPTVSIDSPAFCSGKADTLKAVATGVSSYKWFRNDTAIAGATGSAYAATDSGYYKLIVTNAKGCNSPASDSTYIKENPTPPKPTVSVGSAAFCSGKTDTLKAVTTGASTYAWYRNDTLITGATTANYAATDSGYYQVIATSSLNCSSAVSDSAYIKENITPIKPTISANTLAFCSGKTDTLTAVTTGATAYEWYRNDTLITGATNGSYVATDSGYYQVVATSSVGCNSKVSDSTYIKENPTPLKPTITATSPAFCNGKSDTLKAVAKNVSTYQWYMNNTAIARATDSIYVATDSGYYQVIATTALSCSSPVSDSAHIKENPTPIQPIVSAESPAFCSGKTDTLTAITSGATKYQWYRNDTIITSAIDSSYIATDSGYYQVVATSPLGCSSQVSDSAHIKENITPLKPTVGVSAPAFCSGTSDTLTATVTNAASYQWYKNNSAISRATSNIYAATDSGYYQVIATSALGCVSPASDSARLKVNPLPNYNSVLGNGAVCALAPGVVYSIPSNSKKGYKYQWILPTGVSFVTTPTDTSSSITVSFNANVGTDVIRVIETDSFKCKSTVPDSIVITVAPTPVPVISAPSILCSAASIPFTASPSGSQYYYSWNFGDSTVSVAQDTSNAPNPSHQFGLGNARSANYTVKLIVTDLTAGCKDSTTSPLTVFKSPNVKVIANSDIANNDSLGICSGKNNLSLKDSVWGGVDSTKFLYYWTSNPKRLIIDSLVSDPAAFTASITATYYSIVTDPASSCTAEDSLTIYIKSPTVIADTTALNGKIPLCGLNHNLNFTPSIKGGSGNYNTVWTLEGGSASNYIDTTDLDPVFTGSAYGTFNFIFTVQDLGAHCTVTDSIEVIINRTPSLTLGRSHDTLCAGTPITLTATTHLLDPKYPAKPYIYDLLVQDTTKLPAVVYDTIQGVKPIDSRDTVVSYQFKPADGKNYYAVVVVDSNGCFSNYAIDTIIAEPKQNLYVPNIITPNNDGKNDKLVIAENGGHGDIIFPGATLEVYNRWGDRVFKAQNYPYGSNNQWWNAHGIDDGVYYYYLKTGCGQDEYKGWVQIVSNKDNEQ